MQNECVLIFIALLINNSFNNINTILCCVNEWNYICLYTESKRLLL